MLLNYLRIARRNLLKNTVFSTINIFGLAVGMAAFLFIIQYIRFEKSYENFHVNADNILRVTTDFYNGSTYVVTDCETFAPLGPLLKERMAEVTDFVRLYGVDEVMSVKAGTNNFLETGMYWADPSVFTIFSHPVIDGDLTKALTAQFEVVITKSIAEKYFGRTNVADESMEIGGHVYRVKAVIRDVPANTHLKFSFLLSRLSLKTLKTWYPDDKWNNNNEFTYVSTVPGINLADFNKKLAVLSTTELKDVLSEVKFAAEPIKDIHLYSNKSYEPEPAGNAKIVHYFTLIAIFVIVIAWVNYINMATARAVERGREVGIRKVMGSLKSQLVLQFMSESIIVNGVAGLLALMLFQISFPLLRDLSGLPLTLTLKNDTTLWIMFTGLFVAGSVLSGIYPAFVLASFNPAAVLKGKFKSSNHGRLLRKGLVIFQFGATVILIISLCTVYLQIRHLRSFDLGMNIDQTLVLTGNQIKRDSTLGRTTQTLKTELLQNPEIQSVSRSESLPGANAQELSSTSILRVGDKQNNGNGFMYYYTAIDADFATSMDMQFAAGRNFESGSPNHDMVIVNEEAVKMLGFASTEQAVGSKVTFQTRADTEGSIIIGVLKNFYYRSPKAGHLPMLFYYGEPIDYFALKVRTSDMQATLASVQKTWKNIFPNTVFNYYFLDERYDEQYRADTQFGKVMAAFAVLIVFIACLGLFGLSSYTITQRTKEIGIRKVLGASVSSIVHLLSAEFARTVLIAALIALPVAYFLMNEWLAGYAVRINLNPWIFAFSVVLILLLAMITVSIQTIRTAVVNPTESLKQE